MRYQYEAGYEQNDVSFSFKTERDEGLLFHMPPEQRKTDYFTVYLQNSLVKVVFSTTSVDGIASSQMLTSDVVIVHQQWHTVHVMRSATSVTLTVDDISNVATTQVCCATA